MWVKPVPGSALAVRAAVTTASGARARVCGLPGCGYSASAKPQLADEHSKLGCAQACAAVLVLPLCFA